MSNKIVETIKDSSGEIMQYVLENGTTVDKAQGVEMAKNGQIDGVIIAHSKKGEEYLRTKPDGTQWNNLSSMSNNQELKNCGAPQFFN